MATSQAIRAAGTKLYVRISGVYTLIHDVQSLTGPGGESPDIETTPLDETSGRHYLVDLPNPGEPGAKMNYVPGAPVHEYLVDAWQSGSKEAFKVEYVNGRGWTYDAFVKDFPITAEKGQAVASDMKLKISGVPLRF